VRNKVKPREVLLTMEEPYLQLLKMRALQVDPLVKKVAASKSERLNKEESKTLSKASSKRSG